MVRMFVTQWGIYPRNLPANGSMEEACRALARNQCRRRKMRSVTVFFILL